MKRKQENMTFEDYWEEVGRYIGIHDTVTVEEGELGTEWEDDEIIVFRNSVGCVLSKYNRDKEIVERY